MPYVILILFLLLVERITITALCKNPTSREFLRKNTLFHPNTISLMRIPQGIISVIFAYYGNWSAATLWFAVWMISDLTDGTIARHCQLESETGKWLDPLSDKCMTIPPLLFFCISSNVQLRLDPWIVGLYILTEIIGQSSRLFSKKKAANLFGKGKTAMVTILLAVLALNQISQLSLITQTVVDITLYACLILAILSTYCKIVPDIWYANTFTLANFVCGIIGIYQASQHHYIRCVIYVFVGQFFDLYDGRMARKYGSTKRGALFDDIADATSFGLAIGLMIFNGLAQNNALEPTILPLGARLPLTIFYLGCLFYRLYRFMNPTMTLPKGIFQGMPSPAGAMLAGTSVLVAHELDFPAAYIFSAVCVLAASLLMVSNIPYSHFGQTIWSYSPRFAKMILFILVIMMAILALALKSYRACFIWFCFSAALFYLVYGIQYVNRLKTPDTPTEE